MKRREALGRANELTILTQEQHRAKRRSDGTWGVWNAVKAIWV